MVTVVVTVTVEVETCAHAHTPQVRFDYRAPVHPSSLMLMNRLVLCNYRWVIIQDDT